MLKAAAAAPPSSARLSIIGVLDLRLRLLSAPKHLRGTLFIGVPPQRAPLNEPVNFWHFPWLVTVAASPPLKSVTEQTRNSLAQSLFVWGIFAQLMKLKER